MKTYEQLIAHFSDIEALGQISSLLDWDRAVMMPPAGLSQRARQAEVLGVKIHAMLSDPCIGEALAAINDDKLDEAARANMRLVREAYDLATAVPSSLVGRKTAQEARTEAAWMAAKEADDFSLVADELESLMSLVREYAAARAEKLGVSPYDALMTHYLPGMTSAQVDVIFDDLAGFLPLAVTEILEKQEAPLPVPGSFPQDRQKAACNMLARQLGFGLDDWGRIDVSSHPFTTGIGGDVRVTTRFRENDFFPALLATVHEIGHGFYDHHVPADWVGQPIGYSSNMGMGVHESQSLGLEMQMGRSLPYWEWLAPRLAEIFGGEGEAWSAENLYRHVTRVSRSLIRIDADEVNYPLHVILRYRLEKDLIAGRLAVRDVPEAWRSLHRTLIGIEPPTDREGCLQDIHWYCGFVGYFPAYALGAVLAAQLTARMRLDIPDLDEKIRQGDFFAYTAWMRDQVQSKGCLYPPDELIRKVTGAPLSAAAFKDHIKARYLSA